MKHQVVFGIWTARQLRDEGGVPLAARHQPPPCRALQAPSRRTDQRLRREALADPAARSLPSTTEIDATNIG